MKKEFIDFLFYSETKDPITNLWKLNIDRKLYGENLVWVYSTTFPYEWVSAEEYTMAMVMTSVISGRDILAVLEDVKSGYFYTNINSILL